MQNKYHEVAETLKIIYQRIENMNKDCKIRYIVHLKDNFYMPKTTIKQEFCGSIENISSTSIYFKLNGCGGYVIVPHNEIEWMAPSKVLWEAGFVEEDM